MPTNTTAWINTRNAQLQAGPAPYTPPGDDQIVVRNGAVAVNPLDWIIQLAGSVTYRWLVPAGDGHPIKGGVGRQGRRHPPVAKTCRCRGTPS